MVKNIIIFFILLFVPLSLYAEDYNGFWTVEKKTNCSEFFLWDLEKLKIDNNKAQYTVKNKNGWSHKYIGKVKKNKIGMNSIDATMIGKIKNDKITMKFTNIRDSWEWKNMLSDCRVVFVSDRKGNNNIDTKNKTETETETISASINKKNQNSDLLKLLKKDYQKYKEAVFNLAEENGYSCVYKRGKVQGINNKIINYTKKEYLKNTHKGPHMYFYHSNDYEYLIPMTVNGDTLQKTFFPVVLSFSGKYKKYLENVDLLINDKINTSEINITLPGGVDYQNYTFNKNNYELRVIGSNRGLRESNIKLVDFIFECTPYLFATIVANNQNKKNNKNNEEIEVINLYGDKDLDQLIEDNIKDKVNTKEITEDNSPPSIIINDKFIANENFTANVNGIVTDDSEIVFFSIDGEEVAINNNQFSSSFYVKSNGRLIEIIAIDTKGNKTSKFVELKRENIEITKKVFDNLDPRKIKIPKRQNTAALIIGIENYENTVSAPFAENDALTFQDFALLTLGVPQENMKILINNEAKKTNTLKSILKWLPQVIKEDQTELYVFFSGHGLASENGEELYLLPSDGDPELLADSTLFRNRMFEDINKLNPKSVTVFLDTCYSGGTRSDEFLVAAKPIFIEAEEQEVPTNFTIFSASAGKETAKVLEEAEHGLFSYFMMKGLEGEADSNNDRTITNGELHAFINKNVSRQANQTPQLDGDPEQVLVQW